MISRLETRPQRRGFGKLSMLLLVALVAAGAVGFVWYKNNHKNGAAKAAANHPTYTVKRGDLVIDAVEPGNVEASDALLVRSEVEGRATIIFIVPEGYQITDEDVASSKVLVQLDSSDLVERATQQEISVQSAMANYEEAKASYDIQVNENASSLKQGELNLKFSRMDLDRYLGETAAARFIAGETPLEDLIEQEDLGGEALQTKRTIESDIDLNKEEMARAKGRLEWTKKLEAKGYLTKEDLLADQLSFKRAQVAVEKAEADLKQFSRYDFMKQAEQLRSDWEKAQSELERIKAKNRSQLARADSKLRTSEVSYNRQVDQLEKLRDQIEKCTIVATRTGMVVYYQRNWRRQTEIEEGAEVRERQEMLKIPNTDRMRIKTRVHESVVARVHDGQKAIISVDAIPDKEFHGYVEKVAVLPDSQNRWLNPNLKVYATDVSIEGQNPELKPGMSARVRIILDELNDVVMAPLQAIQARGDQRFCLVRTPDGFESREVVTGDYNDQFIEIKKGLEAGDVVALRRVAGVGVGPTGESAKSKKKGKKSRDGKSGEKPKEGGSDKKESEA